MNKSSIEWTDFTSNPLQYQDADGNTVWGCIHASQGCFHCYSEQLAKRYGRGGKFDVATMMGLTPFVSEKEIHSILTYKPASGKMCFLGDMTDIFGEWVPFELIDQIFAAMALRPDITFQVLTKRADRMLEYCLQYKVQMEKKRANECAYAFGVPAPSMPGARVLPGRSVCDVLATQSNGDKQWVRHRGSDPDTSHLEHPTKRNIAHSDWLVKWFGGQLIVDPFCGTGTTLISQRKLNRSAIGIEINEQYCEIAAKRLESQVLA